MMRDLFSHTPLREVEGNYATRMAHLWVRGDPDLDEQCRYLARVCAEPGDRTCWSDGSAGSAQDDPVSALASEFRVRIVASALSAERSGLFLDLFTIDVREVDWPALAAFYLDAISDGD